MKTKHISLSTIALAALSGVAAGFGPTVPGPARLAPEFAGMPVGWSLLRAWDGFGAAPRHEGPHQDACFDEGTEITPEMMENLETLRGIGVDPFSLRYNIGWRRNQYDNQAVTLTYSFVPDGTTMEATTLRINGQNRNYPATTSSLFSNLDSRFGGNRAMWQYQMDSVFQRWAELTGLTFVRVADDGATFPSSSGQPGVRGDIRIALRPVDGANGVLAYAGSHITMDADEDWGNFAGTYIKLRNVMSHELGHALGLSHVCPLTQTKLMEPIYSPAYDGPRHDDIRGMQQVYGDAYEPNNSPSAAYVMTESLPQTSFTFFDYPYVGGNPGVTTASLNGGFDQDWYRSFLAARMPVSLTVTPVGAVYDDSDQLSDGSCASGTFINSQNAGKLAVAIYGADGQTQIANASAAAPGQPVSLTNVSVPGGNYYAVVYCPEGGSFAPQGYTMTRSIGSPQPPANDACGAAQPFLNGPVYGTTFGATSDGSGWLDIGGISDQGNTQGDVYYTFTATDTGRLEAFTTNAGTPPGQGQAITLHHGCPTSRSNQLPIPDTRHYGMGSMYSDVTAGQTYTVRVGSAPNRPWGGFTFDLRYLNAPANDRCESAIAIGPGTVTGTTQFARRELHGALCSYTADGPTVWYTYTAPYTNTIRVDTCGTAWDTLIGAYRSAGCPVNLGSPAACNDDNGCSGNILASQIDVRVERGETVYLRVSGYNGAHGAFTLNLTQGPVENDTCAGAQPVDVGATAFDTTNAVADGPAEGGCSFCCGDLQLNKDLWYRYTAPENGRVDVDTYGSSYDTKLAAYAACPSGNDHAIACNDDAGAGLNSAMSFQATGGATYLIRVGGYLQSAGAGTLHVGFTRACPADFNGDGFTDFFDYDDYIACFEGQGCPSGRSADFNGDGFTDFFDYDDFVSAFEAGC